MLKMFTSLCFVCMQTRQLPTVRQLINNQKAATSLTHSFFSPSPAILRHAASLPQVVDLTEDDEAPTTGVTPSSAAKNRMSSISQASFPELLSRLDRLANVATAVTARSAQAVVPGLPGGAASSQVVGRGSVVQTSGSTTPVSSNGVPHQNGTSSAVMQALSSQQSSGATNNRLLLQSAAATPQSSRLSSGALLAASVPAVHPAPLPVDPVEPANPLFKAKPPRPILKLQRVEQGTACLSGLK